MKRTRQEIEQRYYFHLKEQIFELLGNKCVHCGFSDPRALQIDHINGGGQKERKRFPSHKMFYMYVLRQLKNGSKDYQLLCANCNWIKRYENKEAI